MIETQYQLKSTIMSWDIIIRKWNGKANSDKKISKKWK